jgi:hypothetical protein
MAGGLEIFMDERVGAWMQRQIARLAAFARHLEMRHAFARVAKIPDLELAQLVAPQRVEQEGRENGAVTFAARAVVGRRVEQFAGLVIDERRRLAFAPFGFWALDTFDWVMGDGVLLAQIFEQRGE